MNLKKTMKPHQNPCPLEFGVAKFLKWVPQPNEVRQYGGCLWIFHISSYFTITRHAVERIFIIPAQHLACHPLSKEGFAKFERALISTTHYITVIIVITGLLRPRLLLHQVYRVFLPCRRGIFSARSLRGFCVIPVFRRDIPLFFSAYCRCRP